jgi:hypothetical protein
MIRAIMVDLDTAVATIDRVEMARAQLATARTALKAEESMKDLLTSADSLDQRLAALEEVLFQIKVTGRGQDIVRWPFGIAEKLGYLAGVTSSSDHPPTDAEREVEVLLRQRLAGYVYERDFGGAVYVFLRGVSRARGPEVGIYTHRLEPRRLDALGRALIPN